MSNVHSKMKMNNDEVENATYFEYLGYIMNNNGNCSKEIRRRLTGSPQAENL